MWLRISLVLLMLQCSGSHNLADQLKPEASFEKYVAGAGGGAGVRFQVGFEQTLTEANFKHFIINGDTLEAAILSIDPFAIEASRFYANPEPVEGGGYQPDPKPLYDTNQYRGILVFELDGKEHELIISEFTQKPSPVYE